MPHTSDRRAPSRSTACILVAAAVALACLAIAPAAFAGPLGIIDDPTATPSFTVTVAGPGAAADAAMGVTADSSGAYVAGTRGNAAGNADASMVRIVGDSQKWGKWYNGSANGDDWVYRIVKRGTAVYAAGWSKNALGKMNILLIKRSASTGALKWVRRYDGPAHDDDAATALGIDKNGNVTVAGYSHGAGGDDWVVVSWSSAGVRRWAWRYAGSAGTGDRPMDLVVDGSNRVYVTGWINVTGPKVKAQTVKLSSTGAVLWRKTTFGAGGLNAAANGIALRPAGGVYVVGRSEALLTGWDVLAMRYTSGGSPAFLSPFAIGGDQDLYDVAVTSNGRIAVAGANDPGGDTGALLGLYRSDGSIVAYMPAGGPVWNDAFVSIAADRYGGYYPVGFMGTAADQCQWDMYRWSAVAGGAQWHSQLYGTAGFDVPGPAALVGVFGGAVATYANKAYVVGNQVTGGPSGIDQKIVGFIY